MQVNLRIYSLDKTITNLFDIPIENRIVTNSLNNALTVLELKDYKIEYKELAKDFLTYVSEGDFVFLPVFSNDIIAYTQSRRLVLFNVKNKKHKTHVICDDLDESIIDVSVIGEDTFFFTIEKFADDLDEPSYILRKYEIDFNNSTYISDLHLQKIEATYINSTNIFVFGGESIRTFGLNMEEKDHPISSLMNQEKGKFATPLTEMVVHPEFPFAILVDDNNKSFLVKWNKELISFPILFNIVESFNFSPDYRWLIYWQVDEEVYKLFAMKINPKSQIFLDPPIFLGEFSNAPDTNSTTWINKPLGYVVNDADKNELFVWEF